MAEQGNFLSEMLAAGQPGTPNVIDNLSKGMDFGQKIQNIPMQNMYRQQKMQEMEKQKQVEAAIKQYGQTGDIKTLQALDPALAANAMKSNEYINSQPPESIKDMTSAYDQLGRIGPMVNEKNWPDVRKRMMAAHPKLSADDFPPENATGDQIFKFVNAVPLLNAQLKLAGQAPKVLNPGASLVGPTGNVMAQAPERPMNPLQQSQIDKNLAEVQDPGRKWKPEPFINPQGDIRWVKPGQETNLGPDFKPTKGAGSSGTSEEDLKTTIDGVLSGNIPPSALSKRNTKGEYTKILAGVQRAGGSLSQLDKQYKTALNWAKSLSNPQQARFEGLAGSVVNTIDEVAALADQLKQSGITPLNKLGLEAKIKLAGNTQEGQLATRYLAATNTLKEEFANLAQGGYAPTEAVWTLANKQINENYGVDQMKASLKEVQRLINYRVNAFDTLREQRAGLAPQSRGGEAGKEAPKQLTDENRQAYTQKLTQVQALPDGPQKQAALKQMQDLADKWGIK